MTTDAPGGHEQRGEAALDELSVPECLELVGGLGVGRVAVCRDVGSPLVVPVNYALVGDSIVFRSDRGSKLTALQRHPVSFQVDEIDPVHRTGWSVLIQGLATVTEVPPADVDVESWAPGAMAFWVRITAASITGRRLRLPPVPPDARAYL